MFTRLDEIQIWQKARDVTRRIHRITGNGDCGRDFGLRSPLRRSSDSVMADIAKGSGRRSDQELAEFLHVAHGSVTGTRSHLYDALDLGNVAKAVWDGPSIPRDEIANMRLSRAARRGARGRKGRTP